MNKLEESLSSPQPNKTVQENRAFGAKSRFFFFVSLFVALVSWAFASPIGASPDEDFHLVSIWCGQGEREGLCEIGENGSVYVSETLIYNSSCFAHFPDVSAGCSSFDETKISETFRSNADKSYPPLFYWIMSIFATPDIGLSVLMMRIFNAVLFSSLLFITFSLSKDKLRMPLVWGYLAAIVPLGVFLIPSVNPSSWAIASIGILWISLFSFFQTTILRNKIGLFLIAFTALVMGSGTRSDSAIYSALAVCIASFLSIKQIKSNIKLSIAPAFLMLVAIAFFFSGSQSSVAAVGFNSSSEHELGILALIAANLVLLPALWVGIFGTWGLGWLDTLMPGSVWVTASSIFTALIFWGLSILNIRKAISISIIFAVIVVLPLYVLVSNGEQVGVGVQPRYIFPLLIFILGLSLLPNKEHTVEFTKVHRWIIVIGLAIANTFALHTNLRRYLTGTDVNQANLDAQIEWWWPLPIGPMWIWIIGSLSLTVSLFFASKLLLSNVKKPMNF